MVSPGPMGPSPRAPWSQGPKEPMGPRASGGAQDPRGSKGPQEGPLTGLTCPWAEAVPDQGPHQMDTQFGCCENHLRCFRCVQTAARLHLLSGRIGHGPTKGNRQAPWRARGPPGIFGVGPNPCKTLPWEGLGGKLAHPKGSWVPWKPFPS